MRVCLRIAAASEFINLALHLISQVTLTSSDSRVSSLIGRYSSLRMCDISDLTANSPLTIDRFLDHIKMYCDKGQAMLKEVWLVECATIVADLREDIESLMPDDEVRNIFQPLDFDSVSRQRRNTGRQASLLVSSDIHQVIKMGR